MQGRGLVSGQGAVARAIGRRADLVTETEKNHKRGQRNDGHACCQHFQMPRQHWVPFGYALGAQLPLSVAPTLLLSERGVLEHRGASYAS
jgi:hypothetical protein